MAPSLSAVLHSVYSSPMFDGLPPGTRWAGDQNNPLWWDSARDRYLFGLCTPVEGGQHYWTLAKIDWHELDALKYATHDQAWRDVLHAKLKLLRMQHYFGLVYRRGGYC